MNNDIIKEKVIKVFNTDLFSVGDTINVMVYEGEVCNYLEGVVTNVTENEIVMSYFEDGWTCSKSITIDEVVNNDVCIL